MKFYALDVETANPSVASVCQMGIALFDNGEIVEKYEILVNPEEYFDSFNTEIHGITKNQVKDSVKFPKVYEYLKNNLEGNIVIHHMPFDKAAVNRASIKYGLLC